VEIIVQAKPDQKASVSAVPAFPGLRLFPDGRDFSQWTGNDSKAFMKVRNFNYSILYHFILLIGAVDSGLPCGDQGPCPR
jgi:hypothetical protein